QYLDPPPESLLALDGAALGRALRDDRALPWASAYSLASGDLPLAEVAAGRGGTAVVRCRLEVAAAGTVQLVLNSARGVALWVEGVPAAAGERVTLRLERGTHQVDLRIEPARRQDGRLRCELQIPAGS